ATFSFYGNKVITSGEGGALTYNDEAVHERILMLRSQGMDRDRRYFHPIVGYNYRLTNVACAILCAQLERWRDTIARRKAVFRQYSDHLSSVPGIGLQPIAAWAELSPWLYCITINDSLFGMDRDTLASRLLRHGIDTRPFFICIHQMPPYRGDAGDRRFPV